MKKIGNSIKRNISIILIVFLSVVEWHLLFSNPTNITVAILAAVIIMFAILYIAAYAIWKTLISQNRDMEQR